MAQDEPRHACGLPAFSLPVNKMIKICRGRVKTSQEPTEILCGHESVMVTGNLFACAQAYPAFNAQFVSFA